jgi:DNA-binding NtrC family response regulator
MKNDMPPRGAVPPPDAADGARSFSSPCAATGLDEVFARLNLLGESPVFRDVLRAIRRVAECDATVLIQGETGTGKELAGRAIHYLSARRDGPFIPVNCGAIPDALVEAELFGHARGAFTDAKETHQGLIAQARGGTLFLDELEALSAHGQVALLRFLQDQEYRPVGGPMVRHADVRVLGSTNADLAGLAARAEYRKDLLFRLNVLTLELPPLRARGDDALVLARSFVRRFSEQYRRPAKPFHPDAVAYLERHAWPGNVRELENLVLRACLLDDGPELRFPAPTERPPGSGRAPAAPAAPLAATSFREAKARAITEFERAYIAELLERASGNISLAARLAGQERSRFGKLVRKHGFSAAVFRGAIPRTDPA